MATWLKQSTAIEIKLGPFVDNVDGFTAETALTITQADVRLVKNENDWAQKSETTSAVHEENGWYRVLLNSTDTNTLGILIVAVNETGALPVWREFMVMPANTYDTLVGGTASLNANVTAMAANTVTASAMATDAMNEIADAVWDESIVGHISDTNSTGWHLDSAQSILNTFGLSGIAVTSGSVSFIVDSVWDEATSGHTTSGTFGEQAKTDIDAIVTKTAGLTFTVANQVDANIESVNGTTVTGSGTGGSPWGP